MKLIKGYLHFISESIEVYRGDDDISKYDGRIWVTKDIDHATQYGNVNTYTIDNDLNLLYVDYNWGTWTKLLSDFDGDLEEDFDAAEDMKYEPTDEFIYFLSNKGYDGFVHGSNGENILIFNRNNLKLK